MRTNRIYEFIKLSHKFAETEKCHDGHMQAGSVMQFKSQSLRTKDTDDAVAI
jgi:hypothetical protein